MSGEPKRITVLESLKAKKVINKNPANENSYMNKYSIHLKDGSTNIQNLYQLVGISDHTRNNDVFNIPITGRSFQFGTILEKQVSYPWDFDSAQLSNRHMLVSGSSGSGKTFFLNKLVRQASHKQIPIYIFHIQGDLPNIKENVEVG